MNLAKAKELLKQELDDPDSVNILDVEEAQKLLIEAASFILLSRVTTPGSVPTLLAGETEN